MVLLFVFWGEGKSFFFCYFMVPVESLLRVEKHGFSRLGSFFFFLGSFSGAWEFFVSICIVFVNMLGLLLFNWFYRCFIYFFLPN